MGYSQISRKVTIGDKKRFAKLRKKRKLEQVKHVKVNKYAKFSQALKNRSTIEKTSLSKAGTTPKHGTLFEK